MLKEADDELSRSIRSMKSQGEATDLAGAQQVLYRIRLLRNLYLLVLNVRYIGNDDLHV